MDTRSLLAFALPNFGLAMGRWRSLVGIASLVVCTTAGDGSTTSLLRGDEASAQRREKEEATNKSMEDGAVKSWTWNGAASEPKDAVAVAGEENSER